MEAIATRMYERLGPRYMVWSRLVYVATAALLCLFGVVLFSLYVEETRAQLLQVLAIAEAGVILSLGWGSHWMLRTAGPIREWIEAGRPTEQVDEVRRVALLFPRGTLLAVGWRVLAVAALPTAAGVAVILEFSGLELGLFMFVTVVAGAYVAALFVFMLEIELRPVLRDLARRLDHEAEEVVAWPGLGTKLMLAIPITNLAAGGFVAVTVTALGKGSVGELGLTLTVALAVTLSMALLPTALIVGSVLAPVRELAAATERAGSGQFEQRIPVLSSDELGLLAESFNEMLDGLAEHDRLLAGARELELETERLELERELEAQRTVLEERAAIARELHDVVAHRVSLIVVQAGSARRSAEFDGSGVAESVDVIEATAAQAREELGRMLAALRGDTEAPPGEQPGTGEIATLIAGVREAGIAVTFDVSGSERALPRGLALSCYRIVQEALTNVVKHGAGGPVSIALSYGHRELEIAVESQPPTAPAPPGEMAPGGHGLIGMRERAELYGGELSAGPSPDGGFRVRARIPIAAA